MIMQQDSIVQFQTKSKTVNLLVINFDFFVDCNRSLVVLLGIIFVLDSAFTINAVIGHVSKNVSLELLEEDQWCC